MLKININLRLLLITLTALILLNCSDNNGNGYTGIPDVYVNKNVNLDLPSYSDLVNIGGYVLIADVGYMGIILYHNASDEYVAIERACTYRTTDKCAVVTVDNSGTFLRCGHYEGADWIACCDSKFTMDGYTVLNGPAKYPLKHYQVYKSGNNLTITN
jgi:nitrite reductase/ring-hydroxylating ferredoxin subunit